MPVMSRIYRLWPAFLAFMFLLTPLPLYAACAVSAVSTNLGSVSSLTLAAQSREAQGSSGLVCNPLLTVASTSFVKVRVDSSTLLLTGGTPSQSIPFVISGTSGGPAIAVGSEFDFSSFSLITLFSGPGGSLPLYFRTTPTAALRAGTYTGSVVVRWYYSVCDLGALGVCVTYSESPNLVRGSSAPTNWGIGSPATVSITLMVTNDCAITAPDLNFGTAPLVGSFNPISQTITIRCSAGAAYTVGLGNGANYVAPWRRMRRLATSDYLRYEIYQTPASALRWGSVGAERRSSATAQTNPAIYDGTTLQGFTYRAAIDPNQTTPAAGTYTDSVLIEIAF